MCDRVAFQKDLDAKKNVVAEWTWFNRFCGMLMAHNYYTYHIFSEIIEKNPQLCGIIELGTFTGAMTTVLGLEGIRKQIPVHTFDIAVQTDEGTNRIFRQLNVNVHTCDIFENNMGFLKNLVKQMNGPIYLLCDNGNKKGEFTTLVPFLPSGSMISVHDWQMEFLPEDAQIHSSLLEPFEDVAWMKHNTLLATWRKK